ncbi:MAG: hydrogen peroxide-inducible genes activator [Prevotella sp.]|uniref:hydrogen peroxide-inducible genes activator n=1 Tax=Prevotella sp. P3-122 TaxID=2024223 RepID=UPI000B97A16B|nr:hydrogen peroxide-inducible genes activator [Prevotella sp. P3-122]MDY5084798.1 hydrogen peroxide-inducible genes activator [Prevotella sp.]OYP58976.1 DNA-binding transcriptional regulator OxyR [Prevotella sp. P3-122]
MTLQQLEYIVAVYRTRHFVKAAEACGVTQPTLSAMIQKLEAELDVKLFERSSQQVMPTAIGKVVVEQAWKVLNRARKLKDIVAEEKKSLTGTFRLGILPTIAPYLLPRFFPRLMRENSSLEIRVVEMKTAYIRRAIDRGEIDAAVMVDTGDLDDYALTTLFYEQFLAYVSPSDQLSAKKSIKTSDLSNELLWLLDEGHCFRDQLVKYCQLKAAKTSQSAYSLGSIETFMRIVENGQGMTFIPELATMQLTPTQKELVRPFAIPIPTREVVMATSKAFVRQSLLNMIVGQIRNSVPEKMLKLNNTEQRI